MLAGDDISTTKSGTTITNAAPAVSVLTDWKTAEKGGTTIPRIDSSTEAATSTLLRIGYHVMTSMETSLMSNQSIFMKPSSTRGHLGANLIQTAIASQQATYSSSTASVMTSASKSSVSLYSWRDGKNLKTSSDQKDFKGIFHYTVEVPEVEKSPIRSKIAPRVVAVALLASALVLASLIGLLQCTSAKPNKRRRESIQMQLL